MRVYAHNPRNMDELEYWARYEWQASDLDHVSKMCSNMKHRLELIIEYEGYKIPY